MRKRQRTREASGRAYRATSRLWRPHLKKGLALAEAAGGWQDAAHRVLTRYLDVKRPNTRFAATPAEFNTIERVAGETGAPRWAVITAALQSAADGIALEGPGPAVAVPATRMAHTFRVPRRLWPWRCELEHGLHFAESGGDWQAPARDYQKDEYARTRFVISQATHQRIAVLANHRGVAKSVVVTVALHELNNDPALAGTPSDPNTAIARLFPPPLNEGREDTEYRTPGVRRRPG